MSDDKDGGKSGPWFPPLNNLLLILLAGTLFVTQAPFHESRPAKPDTATPSAPMVDARLWQDPFEAVDEHKGQHKDTDAKDHLHDLARLQDSIRAKIEADGLSELNVVAVMLPGDPYFEDGETRRRLRYAVLSGFDAAARYLPEDPEHFDFLEEADGRKTAYEWLLYKPVDGVNAPPKEVWNGKFEAVHKFPPVLVLWVANENYRSAPHQKLKWLIEKIDPGSSPPGPGALAWNVHVLGPYDSDNLQDLVNEFSIACPETGALHFRYFSPSATAADGELVKAPPGGSEGQCGPGDSQAGRGQPEAAPEKSATAETGAAAARKTTLHDYFLAHGLPFLRVTTTDQDLAITMKKELGLRGIKPGRNSRIILISEWDTLYGWHLPNTFTNELLDGNGECKGQDWSSSLDADDQCIFRFSYLRGLDGDKVNRKATANNAARGKDKKGGGDGTKDLEPADGDSQFDYVRRLAAKLSDLSGQIADATDNPTRHPIKAVGILGSDVYDKLLILEALHAVFPDAVFFTNGLDARFLHPEQNEWTRNLILVSRFGLELDLHLQRDIPPFRDSTQTAFFLATEMALAHMKARMEALPWFLGPDYQAFLATDSQVDVDHWLQQPRLHEVGRTRLIGLKPADAQGSEAPRCGEDNHKACPIHPPPSTTRFSGHLELLAIALILCFLGGVRGSRRFLGSPAGCWFVVLIAAFCFLGPLYIASPTVFRFAVLTASLGISPPLALGTGLASLSWDPLPFPGAIPNGNGRIPFTLAFGLAFIALLIVIAVRDNRSSQDEADGLDRHAKYRLGFSLALAAAAFAWVWHSATPLEAAESAGTLLGRLDAGEPYALVEGVSMWPSEAIRLLALVVTGYFILDVCRFPRRLTLWMETHLQAGRKLLEEAGECPAATPPSANGRPLAIVCDNWKRSGAACRGCRLISSGTRLRAAARRLWAGLTAPATLSGFLDASRLREHPVLRDWMAWRNIWRRVFGAFGYAVVFYFFGTLLFIVWGFPHTPFRGKTLDSLDVLLTRCVLVPAFVFLLFLVVDAVWKTVELVERAFHEDPERHELWPVEIRALFERRFAIDRDELHEWVGMRFIDGLTEAIYRVIGYPLMIALLMVLARSSYFDDWVMPLAFKLVILFSLALLFFSDYRLKKAADQARAHALKALNHRVVQYQGQGQALAAKAEQTQRLIGMIERSDDVVYRAFTQRPIFRTSLLIVAALLADALDYSTLAGKLF